MRSRDEIEKDLAQIDLQIAKACFEGKRDEIYPELKEKADSLREELKFVDFKKIATDYEIDLYEAPYERGVKYYRITPHDVVKEIGFIKISYGANCIPRYGNIGYEIDERYRGNNYTIRALEMLVEEMMLRGLTKPTLAAKQSNIPSVRIIEKFGGKVIHQAQNQFDWNIYQVDLENKIGQKVMKK